MTRTALFIVGVLVAGTLFAQIKAQSGAYEFTCDERPDLCKEIYGSEDNWPLTVEWRGPLTVEWRGKLILLWEDCPLKNEDGTVDENPYYDAEAFRNALIHCFIRTFPDLEIGLRSDGVLVWRERIETTTTEVQYEGYGE